MCSKSLALTIEKMARLDPSTTVACCMRPNTHSSKVEERPKLASWAKRQEEERAQGLRARDYRLTIAGEVGATEGCLLSRKTFRAWSAHARQQAAIGSRRREAIRLG